VKDLKGKTVFEGKGLKGKTVFEGKGLNGKTLKERVLSCQCMRA
jgi:hypothetical protein